MIGKRRGYESQGGKVRWLVLILIGVVVIFIAYTQYLKMGLRKADRLLAASRDVEAGKAFQRVSGLPLSGGKGHDGIGALALLAGDIEAAKQHFKVILTKKPSGFGGNPEVILSRFLTNGMYHEGVLYREFLESWKPADKLKAYALDFAALSLGARAFDDARERMAAVPAEQHLEDRYKSLKKLLDSYEMQGEAPVLTDRDGTPFLVYDFRRKEARFSVIGLFEGWLAGDQLDLAALLADMEPRDRYNTVATTIDLNLQRSAAQAMTGYSGAMVVMDPNTGELLAAYGTPGIDPFNTAFEPGSVIKPLTYAIFLMRGGDVTPYAPKDYPSSMRIGDQILWDWTTQGKLETVAQGMAVSCNLMFGQMGMETGWPNLSSSYTRLFDGKNKGFLLRSGNFGHLKAEPASAYEIARSAIGLDFLQTTVYGLVAIPAMMANGGKLVEPHLWRTVSNIEGAVYKSAALPEPESLFPGEIADEVMNTMEASVYFEQGTARRAKTDFVRSAMKTGTAGERPFDSVMIGVLPATNPKLAFAFFLSKGGKCEIHGAKVAKSLQEQIRALAPNYLE